MEYDPVVKEVLENRLYQCLPDTTGEDVFVLQHGIVVSTGDGRPHISQFLDGKNLFWPSTLLPQILKSCSIYTQKTQLLRICGERRAAGQHPGGGNETRQQYCSYIQYAIM